MQTELDTTSRVARVPSEPLEVPSLSQVSRTRSLRVPLSKAAIRTSTPSISNLMRMALENPGIVSLAAGFVDQRTLPVEVTARAAANLWPIGTRGDDLSSMGRRLVIPGSGRVWSTGWSGQSRCPQGLSRMQLPGPW